MALLDIRSVAAHLGALDAAQMGVQAWTDEANFIKLFGK
jgi:hypothetical protein